MLRTSTSLLVLVVMVLGAGSAQGTFLGVGEYADTPSTSALYHLNQSAGTTAVDDNSSGRSAHDGTLAGTTLPTWTSAVVGNGLHFGRSDGSLLQMGNLVHTSASFTLEFYLKWDYIYHSEPGYIMTNGGTTFLRTSLIERGLSPALARITFGVRKGDGGWLEINTGSVGLDASKFMHVAVVREWDGVNTTARIYLDGELEASSVHNGGFWDDGADVALGHSGPHGIGGTFDEVRFTKAALSEFGVPEPATMTLLALGALAVIRRRR